MIQSPAFIETFGGRGRPDFEMNIQTRPKLYPPLALLAAIPAPAGAARLAPPTAPRPADLRRLVAAMID
jgi:hypothetical protein